MFNQMSTNCHKLLIYVINSVSISLIIKCSVHKNFILFENNL